jgi:alkylated DNA repair dioxygenase AlkB
MISGLSYIPDYVNATEEQNLITQIDAQVWITALKRRVQHYGYIYDYKKRVVTKDMFLGHLPDWLASFAERIYKDRFIAARPDQVIINEYYSGQGIASHIDCEPCFGDTILSLSLGSACVMDFDETKGEKQQHLLLESRSLLVMQGEARYQWKHGIVARKSDIYDGKRFQRARRLSLTLRKVVLD